MVITSSFISITRISSFVTFLYLNVKHSLHGVFLVNWSNADAVIFLVIELFDSYTSMAPSFSLPLLFWMLKIWRISYSWERSEWLLTDFSVGGVSSQIVLSDKLTPWSWDWIDTIISSSMMDFSWWLQYRLQLSL